MMIYFNIIFYDFFKNVCVAIDKYDTLNPSFQNWFLDYFTSVLEHSNFERNLLK